ncbi:MAG: C13 family peptidase [Rhizomicrobium sp.]|jgi:hypothetical protein
MRSAFFRIIFVAASAMLVSTTAQSAGPFSDWAAVVVAGDWHAHDGRPSDIFDNSRNDVTRDLLNVGFSKDNIAQFSVRPERYTADAPGSTDATGIADTLWDMSNRTSAGCLIYLSSHGSPDGVILGDETLGPDRLRTIVSNSCSDRPTVVIISACFSGVFVKPLQAPNRMILTAARGDRTSFGCGATNKYPYFDQCILSVWPAAGDFPDLGRKAQACVAEREKKEHLVPASEPQLWVGETLARTLPSWDVTKSTSTDVVVLKPPPARGTATHGRPAHTPS